MIEPKDSREGFPFLLADGVLTEAELAAYSAFVAEKCEFPTGGLSASEETGLSEYQQSDKVWCPECLTYHRHPHDRCAAND